MLKIESDKGFVKSEIVGDVFDITADFLMALENVYERLWEDSKDVAEIFEKAVTSMIGTAFAIAKKRCGKDGKPNESQ